MVVFVIVLVALFNVLVVDPDKIEDALLRANTPVEGLDTTIESVDPPLCNPDKDIVLVAVVITLVGLVKVPPNLTSLPLIVKPLLALVLSGEVGSVTLLEIPLTELLNVLPVKLN